MTEREKFYLTEKGARRLEQRIREIKAKMEEDAKWLTDAPALSAPIENYYHSQLELNRLLAIQRQSHIVNEKEARKLGIGRKITILDSEVGKPEEFTVLSSQEADPLIGIISFESPLAKATLGRKDGEMIEVPTPSGIRKMTLLQTTWIFFDIDSEETKGGSEKGVR